ncbi:unnamed protein product [Alternaria alternata]
MSTSPNAFVVATAVLLEAPDEDVEDEVVPSRAAAAADAALPEEKDVPFTKRARGLEEDGLEEVGTRTPKEKSIGEGDVR